MLESSLPSGISKGDSPRSAFIRLEPAASNLPAGPAAIRGLPKMLNVTN